MDSQRPKFTVLVPKTLLHANSNLPEDPDSETFAEWLNDKSEELLGRSIFYPTARGEAHLDKGFDDFEENYLKNSETLILVLSSWNHACLNHLYPRLLVFLTRRPIWLDKILLVFLGSKSESYDQYEWDLITKEPIIFHGSCPDEWQNDTQAWNVLYQYFTLNDSNRCVVCTNEPKTKLYRSAEIDFEIDLKNKKPELTNQNPDPTLSTNRIDLHSMEDFRANLQSEEKHENDFNERLHDSGNPSYCEMCVRSSQRRAFCLHCGPNLHSGIYHQKHRGYQDENDTSYSQRQVQSCKSECTTPNIKKKDINQPSLSHSASCDLLDIKKTQNEPKKSRSLLKLFKEFIPLHKRKKSTNSQVNADAFLSFNQNFEPNHSQLCPVLNYSSENIIELAKSVVFLDIQYPQINFANVSLVSHTIFYRALISYPEEKLFFNNPSNNSLLDSSSNPCSSSSYKSESMKITKTCHDLKLKDYQSTHLPVCSSDSVVPSEPINYDLVERSHFLSVYKPPVSNNSSEISFFQVSEEEEDFIGSFSGIDLETILEKTESAYDLSLCSVTNQTFNEKSSNSSRKTSDGTNSTFSGSNPWGLEAYNQSLTSIILPIEISEFSTNKIEISTLNYSQKPYTEDSGMFDSFSPDSSGYNRTSSSLQGEAQSNQTVSRPNFEDLSQTPSVLTNNTSKLSEIDQRYEKLTIEVDGDFLEPTSTSKERSRNSSLSPIYRDDLRASSAIGRHTSRKDKHFMARKRIRTNSSKCESELLANDSFMRKLIISETSSGLMNRSSIEQNVFSRPRLPSNLVETGTQTMVEIIDVNDLSIGDTSSRDSSFERHGEIKTTQLPDGGWLTGVFSWILGSRRKSVTPGLKVSQLTIDGEIPLRSYASLGIDSAFSGLNNIPGDSMKSSQIVRRRTFNSDTNDLSQSDFIKYSSELQLNEAYDNGRASPMSVMGDSYHDTRTMTRRLLGCKKLQKSYTGWGRDFAVSLINTCLIYFMLFLTAISFMPRHIFWFYTSARLTHQRLSELMSPLWNTMFSIFHHLITFICPSSVFTDDYDRKVPTILQRAKETIKNKCPDKATCLFISTSLVSPLSRMIPGTVGGIAGDAQGLLPYRFGAMSSLLRPSLMWTGSMVLSKVRPGLYSATPSIK